MQIICIFTPRKGELPFLEPEGIGVQIYMVASLHLFNDLLTIKSKSYFSPAPVIPDLIHAFQYKL